MADPLSDDEVEKIIEAYKEHGTKQAAHEETGHSLSTVKKYVDGWEADQAKDDPDAEYAPAPKGYTAQPPSSSDPEKDPANNPDFATMSESEFIEWFFEHRGFGVRTNFAKNLGQRCEIRGEIPDKAEMCNRILTQKSGVSNDGDANMLAENYWAAAQRWLDANGRSSGGSGQGYVGPRGDWVSGQGDTAAGQQGGSPAGQWVTTDGGGQPAGAGTGGGGPPPRSNGQGQPPGQHGQQGAAPGQPGYDPRVARLEDSVNDLKEAVTRLVNNERRSGEQREEVRTVKDTVNEMAEIEQTLDQIRGSDNDEATERLMARLESLEDRLEREAANANQDPEAPGQMGNDIALIAQLVKETDDPEVISTVAGTLGATDPETKRAEFDYKKTTAKLENRKELVDNVIDGLSDLSGSAAASVVDALTSGDDDEGDDEGDGAGQAQSRGGGDDGRGEGTVSAGSSGSQTGQIQVVGEDGDPSQSSGDEEYEPVARRRFADRVDGNGRDRPSRTGGIRSPSGDSPEPQGAGGCEWIEDGGDVCGDPTLEGDTLCEAHRAVANDQR